MVTCIKRKKFDNNIFKKKNFFPKKFSVFFLKESCLVKFLWRTAHGPRRSAHGARRTRILLFGPLPLGVTREMTFHFFSQKMRFFEGCPENSRSFIQNRSQNLRCQIRWFFTKNYAFSERFWKIYYNFKNFQKTSLFFTGPFQNCPGSTISNFQYNLLGQPLLDVYP